MSFNKPFPVRPIVDGNGRPNRELIDWMEEFLRSQQAFLTGEGDPEGSVTAPVGYLYLRSDGGASTTLYIKESGTGNTGWVAK